VALPPSAQLLDEVTASLRAQGRVVLCHIVRAEGSTPGKPGWRLLVRADGSAAGNLGGGAFEAMVALDARGKVADPGAASEVKRYYLTEEAVRGEATGMVCGGMAEVFLEVLVAAPLLVLCGGGPVAQATARAGALAGFEIVVAEDRAEFRRPEDFPPGTVFAAVDRSYAEPFLAGVERRELFVASVSRCWETDLAALVSVLQQDPPGLRYLGLMGSQRKVRRIRAELARRGFDVELAGGQAAPPGAGRLLHAPIGLPIGGDTPGEIAIAIVAQVLEVRHRSHTDTCQPATATAASSPSP
jgi:xanthine dehydrogenase accessory factor